MTETIAAATKAATESFESYSEEIQKLWEYRKELLRISIELFQIKGSCFALGFQVSEEGERIVAFQVLEETGILYLSGNTYKEPGSFDIDSQTPGQTTDSGSINAWLGQTKNQLENFSRFAAKKYSHLVLGSDIANRYPTVEVAKTILDALKEFQGQHQ